MRNDATDERKGAVVTLAAPAQCHAADLKDSANLPSLISHYCRKFF